jgi:hypothetical protein
MKKARRRPRKERSQRDKQAGKAIERMLGDRGQILFPDHGAKPLKIRIRRFQNTPGDGHGSHMNGRHKLG